MPIHKTFLALDSLRPYISVSLCLAWLSDKQEDDRRCNLSLRSANGLYVHLSRFSQPSVLVVTVRRPQKISGRPFLRLRLNGSFHPGRTALAELPMSRLHPGTPLATAEFKAQPLKSPLTNSF
jgi:hypothetical protein